MHRIDTSTKSVNKFGAGKHGFNDGNRVGSIAATQFNAAWSDSVQEELSNVIEGFGGILDPADNAQVFKTIKAAIAAGATDYIARYTTTANIALTGLGTQAGGDWPGALTAGDVLLVQHQTTGGDNGWYIANSGAWTRATFANISSEIKSGALTQVTEGATLADTVWMLTTDGAITLGTTTMAFAMASGVSKFLQKLGDIMLGALGFVAGSPIAPGLYASGDTNTGIFSPGADTLAITTGGTEVVRFDSSGNVLFGVNSGACHRFEKTGAEGTMTVESGGGLWIYVAAGSNPSSSPKILGVSNNATTGRSINTSGTINASGADYAEYEHMSITCGTVSKGQVIGFDSDGKITDKFANSFRFGVKSTAPSYVGGDVWGSPEALGMSLPEEPNKDNYVEPSEYDAAYNTYVVLQAKYDETLESARRLVDRISYTGKVPINVIGASVGDFIVPIDDGYGGISGILIKDNEITLRDYLKSVGKVNRILDDGRAEIVVKSV